jgi:cytoskeleton protein RodZ
MTQEIFEKLTSTTVNGPGSRLRQVREAKKITLDAAAKHLRLSESRLIALEADNYQEFKSATFARGHLRAYAKWLGHSEEEVVKSFDESGFGDSILSIKPQWIHDKVAIAPRKRNSSWLPYSIASLAVVIMVSGWYVHQNRLRLANLTVLSTPQNAQLAIDPDTKVPSDSSQQSMIVQPLPIQDLPLEETHVSPPKTDEVADQPSVREE